MDVMRGVLLILLLLPFWGQAKPLPSEQIYQQYHYFNDNTRSFQLSEITQAPEAIWHLLETKTPNFSLSAAVHWLRVKLHNPNDRPFHGYFAIKTPHQDYISALSIDDKGNKSLVETGDRVNFNSRPVKNRYFNFPVSLKARGSATLFFQLKSHDGFYEIMPLELIEGSQWQEQAINESMMMGLYYGAASILFFYNMALFISTRDRRFASYSFYLFAFSAWNLTFNGYSFQYLWPEKPDWNNQFLALTVIVSFWSFCLFAAHFMALKQQANRFYQVIKLLNALLLLPLVMVLLGYYATPFTVIFGLVSVLFMAVMGISLWLTFKGKQTALIFFTAWLVLFASLLLYIAQLMDLTPASPYTAQAINWGSLIEFLILAIAVSVKFNRSQEKNINYQTQRAEENTKHKEKLQLIVEEQIAQLDEAQTQLADIAVTDSLTGLFNRRHFSRNLENELKQPPPPGEMLVLILIDIDQFRIFNDQHGHTAGDQALAQFAQLLKESFHDDNEQIFRVGGEEFAILYRVDSNVQIHSRLTALSIHANQGNIALNNHSNNALKYSVGVATLSANRTIPTSSALYRLADEALFSAKSSFSNEPVILPWKANLALFKGEFA